MLTVHTRHLAIIVTAHKHYCTNDATIMQNRHRFLFLTVSGRQSEVEKTAYSATGVGDKFMHEAGDPWNRSLL